MNNDRPRTDDSLARAQAALEEEHRALRNLVGRLREVADATALVPLLEELHGALKEHFEHEEFPGGLYQSMGALGPRYAAQVRDLVDQHFLLLAAVRGLADQARRASPPASPALLRDAAALAEQLRTHEADENRLAERLLEKP
jgi:hypothetical protein